MCCIAVLISRDLCISCMRLLGSTEYSLGTAVLYNLDESRVQVIIIFKILIIKIWVTRERVFNLNRDCSSEGSIVLNRNLDIKFRLATSLRSVKQFGLLIQINLSVFGSLLRNSKQSR